jgi:hypothetical protein
MFLIGIELCELDRLLDATRLFFPFIVSGLCITIGEPDSGIRTSRRLA